MVKSLLPTTSITHSPTIKNGRRKEKSLASIYWGGPVSMFSAVIAGLLIALAHHLFYHYLHNRYVLDVLLSQAWVNNIATALAFLSKLMFVIASSIAYTQWQWLVIGKSEHKIDQVDALTGVLDDLTNFLDVKTWIKRPVLLCMAVITWCLPIAAIFTPGTLSVQPTPFYNDTRAVVPLPSYHDLHAFVQTRGVSGYTAPTMELSRIALASSTSGRILAIPSQFQNETYSIQFTGPALRCAVSSNQGLFGVALHDNLLNDTTQDTFDVMNYVAFVPDDDRGFLGTNMSDTSSIGGGYTTLDQISNDTARIYVMPGRLTPNTSKATLLECQLHNATYELDLNFAFPNQTITTRSIQYLNPVNATMGYCSLKPGFSLCDSVVPHPYDHMAYQAIMDAFGSVIAGAESVTHLDPEVGWNQTFSTSRRLTVVDWESTETARRGLEELFLNITLSTMSATSMTVSSIDDQIPVTVTTYPNSYQYDAKFLILSYGLSFFFSLICTLMGSYAMWRNQASYANQFSTYLRAAWNRNPNLDMWIVEDDRGREPLPKDIGASRIKLDGQRSFNMRTSMPSSSTGLIGSSTALPVPRFSLHPDPWSRSSTPSSDGGPPERHSP